MRGFSAPQGRRRWAVGALVTALLVVGAAPVLAVRTPTDPEPDIECHEDYGTGWLTQYVTTVETPADSADWYVSVEFTIAGEGASCELVLATYELESDEFAFPQTLYDSDGGTFGPGTYTLTAALPREGALPGCWSQYDFAFGPAISELTFENRYGDRLVRARIVGAPECTLATPTPTPSESEGEATPTPTPSESEPQATPTSTPRDGELGGTPTPTPGGELPDTRMETVPGGSMSILLALLLAGSLLVLTIERLASARTRR